MKAIGHHLCSFLILVALLGLTVGGAFIPLGFANFAFAMLISLCQAFVIGYFFMELRQAAVIIRVTAFVGIVWLLIMLSFALTDYTVRWPGTLQH